MTIALATMGLPRGFRTLDNITAINDTGLGSATYGVRYSFTNDGDCDSLRNEGADIFNQLVLLPAALKETTWVRLTEVSGLTLTIGTPGTWQQMNAVRTFGAERSLLESTYSWKIELATDSGGTNIVETRTLGGSIGKIV